MRRRYFITLLGVTAAAWPLAGRAQQPAMPVIGFLGSATAEGYRHQVTAFRQGLDEIGYVEGRNVTIEFRWAENQYNQLPALAADLVQRRVAVIVAVGAVNAAFAAKAATATMPIVFGLGSDPVQLGLVPSLARPSGNITGVTTLGRELLAKRLEILRELLPRVTVIGLLVNPSNPNTEPSVHELQQLAQAGGCALHVVPVTAKSDLDIAISTLARAGTGAFFHAIDALFNASYDQMVALAARYRILAVYAWPDPVENGGLMSYGVNRGEEYRLVGRYAARDSQGREAGRPSSPTGHESGARHQHEDCQGSWPHIPHRVAASCRRGDRMTRVLFAALHMSPCGT
jgi:putative ABC transport system substrate-binding protein